MAQVDYFAQKEDMRVAVLGSMGFSTHYIAQRTKLSHYQVLYRLSKARISRQDYRNGVSPIANMIVKQQQDATVKSLSGRLRLAMGNRKKKK